ncbi:hypothetical protein EV714DRAFT_278540, partial [Schizophyllum commune]
MDPTPALQVPELLIIIFESEVLSPGDLGQFARVCRAWYYPAVEALWRDLPGLEPLLSLIHKPSYEWIYQTRTAGRRTLIMGASLRLDITDDKCKDILSRSRRITHLTLHYRRSEMDMCIYQTLRARVEPRLGVFLPHLRTVTIVPPPHGNGQRHRFVPYFPSASTRARDWRCRTGFSVLPVMKVFPQVFTFLVGRQFLPTEYLRALHIRGQSMDVLVNVVEARATWPLDE